MSVVPVENSHLSEQKRVLILMHAGVHIGGTHFSLHREAEPILCAIAPSRRFSEKLYEKRFLNNIASRWEREFCRMNFILRWCKGLAEVGVGKSTSLHNLPEAIEI